MRRTLCTAVSLAAATLLVAPVARAQISSRRVERASTTAAVDGEIRALNDRWQAAIDAKSADRVAAFYAPNAVFMAPNAPKASGNDIYSAWSGMLRTPGMRLRIRPATITPSNDGSMAYDVGTYEFRSTGTRGRSATDRGKYLVVWAKQPTGEWKVAADMFNSDLQAPR